jgi:hypothetical protein
MRQKILLSGKLVLVLAVLVLPEMRAQERSNDVERSTIPFKLESNFLVIVDGQIGSLNRLRFILDTLLLSRSLEGSLHYVFSDWRRMGETLNTGTEVYHQLKPLAAGALATTSPAQSRAVRSWRTGG